MALIRPAWTPPLAGSGHFAFGIDVDWTEDVTITYVRWYHPTGEATADVIARVWDEATQVELAEKTALAANIVDGWNEITLDTPVAVTALTTYTISGETTGAHGYTTSETPPINSPDGLATIVQTRFQGGGGYPATAWGGGQHGVDVGYSEEAAIDLVIQDATQAQAVDNLTLTQTHNLTVQDAAQAQAVDTLTLTQTHILAIQDAVQAQNADNITLTQVHNLVINDARQTQTVDNVGIASGDIVTPPHRTISIAAQSRQTTIEGEDRTYVVPSV